MIELQKTVDGITTVIELVSGQTVTFGSPVVADPSNVEPVRIILFDAGGLLGSFALDLASPRKPSRRRAAPSP